MLNVKSLKETKSEGNLTLNMIVYGASGVGKTTLAATSAELGKVLYIDAEAGSKFIDEKYANKIDILSLDNVYDLTEVLKPENIKEYNTVVLDSLTEIMKKLVDKVKGTKEQATMQDWGKIISQMETYVRKFRDLNKNVIICALESEKEDDGTILKRPSISGKNLPNDIIGFMDICLYLENTQQGRIAHTEPSNKFYAKNRGGKLPSIIKQEDLNIKSIYEKVSTPAKMITEEQLKKIYAGINTLQLGNEAITKMADYGGGLVIEDLTEKGAEKVIKALDLKIGVWEKENAKTDKTPQKEEKTLQGDERVVK